MKFHVSDSARLLVVFVIVATVATMLLTGSTGAQTGCSVKVVGETQYISCWKGRELESQQVPEYLVGAGVIVKRSDGKVAWIPSAGVAKSVKQINDDRLVVKVDKPVQVLFFRFNIPTDVQLSIDTSGNVLP